jgi:hypothetical protein
MNLEWAVISCHVISRIFIILQSHIRSCGSSSSQDIEFYDTNGLLWIQGLHHGWSSVWWQIFFTDAIPDYARRDTNTIKQHSIYYRTIFWRCITTHRVYRGPPIWLLWARTAQSVLRLATGWAVRWYESRWWQDFLHPFRPVLRTTQPPREWVLSQTPGQSGWSMALTNHPNLNAEVKERVEQYLYSPSVLSWQITR